ncbi:MAG: ERCC4 domain-containing protein [Syntrophobacteraceae bacterium]
MRIIADTREQRPYTFSEFGVEVERATLPCGDYSIAGFSDLVAVERKNSVDELVMCLSSDRKRFEAELSRARNFERFYVVIEGHFHDVMAGRYRSHMQSKSVIASIAAFTNRYRIPFLFFGGRGAAEMMTYQLLQKYVYEIEKRYERATKSQESAL